ncbi:MAG: FAD-dependent oxidoreductase [Opitutaceae bacterium]|nr:FAD-dependent oxidoreductase [Opitutaceae bacterium]
MPLIHEPARATPVCHEADLCIVGGSCTGVFAAVRAARLGLSVALVEQNTILGGMAAAAQVNEWHSISDTSGTLPIIGGLTLEVVERLRHRGVLKELHPVHRGQYRFNSAELAIELDDLVRAHRIRVFLAARCVAATRDGARITAAIIEDRSGRRAITAPLYIDASGDGNLLRHAGFAAHKPDILQPVNLQAIVAGVDTAAGSPPWNDLVPSLAVHNYPAANSRPWYFPVPGAPTLRNLFGARLNGVDASDADAYTAALMEARRLHRAYLDLVRTHSSETHPVIVSWAHTLGVRETWHARCHHRLTGAEILRGQPFADSIAQGTYPVDIHSSEGTVLRYLDGREEVVARDGSHLWRRWQPENTPVPACYHIPYRTLLPLEAENLLVAGRLLDADREAFGGVRVMVNMNQTGEAAGVAAALAHRTGTTFPQLDPALLRSELNAGGSLLLPSP